MSLAFTPSRFGLFLKGDRATRRAWRALAPDQRRALRKVQRNDFRTLAEADEYLAEAAPETKRFFETSEYIGVCL